MGIFRQFPYSNFHDMNMDQIIKIMREMQDEWAATKTEWASYKEYIDNYFANLNLDAETEAALRRLINDGSLDHIIDPAITAEVTRWLDENVTPTTPIIDDTLSIQGAGADAKITGLKIEALENELPTGLLKLNPLWVQGGIDGSTGQDTTVSTQIRTDEYIFVGTGSHIVEECKTDYGCRLNFYNKENNEYTFIGHTNHSFGGKRVHIATGDYLRISAYNSSYSAITPAENTNISAYVMASINNDAKIYTNPSRNLYAKYDTLTKILTMPSYAILVYGHEKYDIKNKTIDLSAASDGYGMIFYNPKTDTVKILGAGAAVLYTEIFNNNYYYIGYIWGEFVSFNIYPCYIVNEIMCDASDEEYIKFKQFSGVEKMAVLGDSISTFVGYNETQAEGYYSDGTYPASDVTQVSDTWWYQVAHGLRFPVSGIVPSAVSLSAVSRSSFKVQSDPTIVPSYDSRRIDRLDINGYPSLIYIAMGTNDCFSPVSSIGDAPSTISVAQLSAMDMDVLYNAVYRTVRAVQDAYSGSYIIGIVPKWINLLTAGITYEQFRKTLDAIKQAYIDLGVYVIDLRECGINQRNVGTYTYDGIHPNAAGMKRMSRFIVAKTMECGVANASNY